MNYYISYMYCLCFVIQVDDAVLKPLVIMLFILSLKIDSEYLFSWREAVMMELRIRFWT